MVFNLFMKLSFIGSASDSGKTTVVLHFKELLGNDVAVYDFGDIGVPKDVDKKWRSPKPSFATLKMRVILILLQQKWQSF